VYTLGGKKEQEQQRAPSVFPPSSQQDKS